MRLKSLLPVFFVVILGQAFGQQKPKEFPAKIRVILLGTFHFAGTSDAKKTAFDDLFSPARQQQLETITNGLSKQPITKIFVEAEPTRQGYYDTLYTKYLKHEKIDSIRFRNEIVQLGFREAAKLKLKGVQCVDVQEELPYGALDAFEKKHKDMVSPPIFDMKWPFTDKTRQKPLQDLTLQDYFKQLNSPYNRKSLMFDYMHYAMAYTEGNDYTGVGLSTTMYDRNLKIYTNILRNLTANDNTILVIFGTTHVAFFRQFFESHPSFEIVELDNLF